MSGPRRPVTGASTAKSGPPRQDPVDIVEASFVGGAGPEGELPPPTVSEVAFAGRSNVGKSSLINALVQRRGLVRTGATPGVTRQVNVFEARARDGMVLNLVDLPGYGFARRSRAEKQAWAKLVEGYLERRATLGAVVVVIDARRGIEDDDRELIEFVSAAHGVSRRRLETVVVATKLDKIPSSRQKAALSKLREAAGHRVEGFSAVTGAGRIELWRSLRRAALGDIPDPTPAEPGGDAGA